MLRHTLRVPPAAAIVCALTCNRVLDAFLSSKSFLEHAKAGFRTTLTMIQIPYILRFCSELAFSTWIAQNAPKTPETGTTMSADTMAVSEHAFHAFGMEIIKVNADNIQEGILKVQHD